MFVAANIFNLNIDEITIHILPIKYNILLYVHYSHNFESSLPAG